MKKRKTFFSDPNNWYLINWKSVILLKRYMTRFGNIKPRKYTNVPVKIQKRIRRAIIRARELWLLPYIK
jgi:ribosomal protein S18